MTVVTDVLSLEIDTAGGDLVSVQILGYPVRKDRPDELITLLDDDGPAVYALQSGLLGSESPAPEPRARYSANQNRYELAGGQDEMQVAVIVER